MLALGLTTWFALANEIVAAVIQPKALGMLSYTSASPWEHHAQDKSHI